MTDPLAEIVTLLQPSTPFTKIAAGAGPWRVRRVDIGGPFYFLMLQGGCRLLVGDRPPMVLQAGDFVLIPDATGIETTSLAPPPDAGSMVPVLMPDGSRRLGRLDGPPDMVMLLGHCVFGSPDAALLVSLLPRLILVRGEARLEMLVRLVNDESRAERPGREVILARLLEVLLIEALRADAQTSLSPGLLRGLADDRLAVALRRLHERPAESWTVARLAKEAALSRSAFFDRFRRALGVAPMEYLLAWRMALARHQLRRGEGSIADIARRVGYSSASTFSVAFARHVGQPPGSYARGRGAVAQGEMQGETQGRETVPTAA